eukprot:EG_transcript_15948
MPLAVLVEGATLEAVEPILDQLDADFGLPMTSISLRDDGLVICFESATATGQVLDAQCIVVDNLEFPLSAVTVPKEVAAPAITAPRPSSPGPSASEYAEEEYLEDEEQLWPEEVAAPEPPPKKNKICHVFPKHFRRTLSGVGIILSTALTLMGIIRAVQNWANPIEGYQLFARWLFPFVMMAGGLNLLYAEVLRLHPHLQLGRWRPGQAFRHRGTRGLIYLLVGSVAMDLNQMAIVVGFMAMLLELLNIVFGIWYHCSEFLQGRMKHRPNPPEGQEEVPPEEPGSPSQHYDRRSVISSAVS